MDEERFEDGKRAKQMEELISNTVEVRKAIVVQEDDYEDFDYQ